MITTTRFQSPLYHPRDVTEGESPLEEPGHGDLVGGVERARSRPSLRRRIAREPQARKGVRVRALEGELAHGREIERRNRHVGALGEVQGV